MIELKIATVLKALANLDTISKLTSMVKKLHLQFRQVPKEELSEFMETKRGAELKREELIRKRETTKAARRIQERTASVLAKWR